MTVGKILNYVFLKHAYDKLADREDIEYSMIKDCLLNPGQKIKSFKNRIIYQKKVFISGKERLLRLVVEKEKIIVTVYFTDKIKKYWEG